MLSFLFIVVFGWIAFSLAVGVHCAFVERGTREQVAEAVVQMLTLPYHTVVSLYKLYRK